MSWLDFIVEQWVLFSLLLVLVVAFLTLESRKGGAAVTQSQATRLINNDEAVLIDLREAKEYKAGHIVDAVHVPYANLSSRLDDLEKYRGKQLILVDKMGQHAGAAGKTLRDKGFNVVRLQGGMVDWLHQNLPVVKT